MRWINATSGIVLLSASVASDAQVARPINLPEGPLHLSIAALSSQANVSVGGVDSAMRNTRTRAVRGRMTARAALRRMLTGTALTFRAIDRKTFRIVRRRSNKKQTQAKPAKPTKRRPALQPALPPAPIAPQPIIVTASKMDMRLADYAGTAHILNIDAQPINVSSQGLNQLTNGISSIAQTELGAGRNKLFVRGIADSSINGPTQSTLAFYLNDMRLSYAAPNPDLPLYDVERIEIIEGPQGSLYGAGAIGGVIRTVTKPADTKAFEAEIWSGAAVTAHGDESADLAAMVNLPIDDKIAARVVGYYRIDGGYIDDSQRGIKDINRSSRVGWRASIGIKPGDGWMLDLVAAGQRLDHDDGQYAERNQLPLTRRSAVPQPFDLDNELYSITVKKTFDNFNLVSATGLANLESLSVFDATNRSVAAEPTIFVESLQNELITHETRVSKSAERTKWLIGLSYLRSETVIGRFFGESAELGLLDRSPAERVTELALFGELALSLSNRLDLTMGGRAVYSYLESANLNQLFDLEEPQFSRKAKRVLPTAALNWSPDDNHMLYARYQRGYRIGGTNVSGADPPVVTVFAPDAVDTIEMGARHSLGLNEEWKISHSYFYTKWRDVQADLIDEDGFPRTVNIGSGRIFGATASVNWSPVADLALQLSGFVNGSEITDFSSDFIGVEESRLPNIAGLGLAGQISWEKPISTEMRLHLRSSFQYVGESVLGNVDFLDIDQGDYFQLNAGVGLDAKNWALEFNVSNILNNRANRFSLGNPFSVADGQQITPLRPATGRLSFRYKF